MVICSWASSGFTLCVEIIIVCPVNEILCLVCYYLTNSDATGQPGIAEPHTTSKDVDDTNFKYLILMSDGVYKTMKSIQMAAGHEGEVGIENELVAQLVDDSIKEGGIQKAASNVLKHIRQRQYDLYQKSAQKDANSPVATANRKRDDMTLVVYQFNIVS